MVNVETIEKEILELEAKDPSWAVVERLAWAYIVRDHLNPSIVEKYTGGTSDLEKACEGVPIDKIIDIFGKHMDMIQVVAPREYEAVMSRLNSFK